MRFRFTDLMIQAVMADHNGDAACQPQSGCQPRSGCESRSVICPPGTMQSTCNCPSNHCSSNEPSRDVSFGLPLLRQQLRQVLQAI